MAEIKDFSAIHETDFLQMNGKTVGAIEFGNNRRVRNTLFYHTDGVGSVLGMTDNTATVVENELYDPFGVVLAENRNLSQNQVGDYQFVGAYGVRRIRAQGGGAGTTFQHDIMGVRMYDASVGRFISADPLGFKADTNFYRYVKNNPMRWIDPRGLKSCGSGWNEPFVPDAPGGYDFSSACQKHDACYDTCGIPKNSCDANFYLDMVSTCKSGIYGDVTTCIAYARLYFMAVFKYGWPYYDAAQKTACKCGSK